MKTKRTVRRCLLVIALCILTVCSCSFAAYALEQGTNAAQVIGSAPTNQAVEAVASKSYDYLTSILNFLRTLMIIIAAISLAGSFIRFGLMSNAQKREAAKDKILVILVAVAIGAAAISITTMAISAGRNATSITGTGSGSGQGQDRIQTIIPPDTSTPIPPDGPPV